MNKSRPTFKSPTTVSSTADAGRSPKAKNAAASEYKNQAAARESSFHGKRGKPERMMAEIRREILQKVMVRLQKERLDLRLNERRNDGRTNNIENNSAPPVQNDEI
jgi:hypothetical protein